MSPNSRQVYSYVHVHKYVLHVSMYIYIYEGYVYMHTHTYWGRSGKRCQISRINVYMQINIPTANLMGSEGRFPLCSDIYIYLCKFIKLSDVTKLTAGTLTCTHS